MLLYDAIHIATLTLTAWLAFRGKEPFPLFLPFMVMVVIVEIWLSDWYYAQYGNLYPIINPYAKFCIYYYLFVFYQYFKDKPWAGKLKYGIVGFITITLFWNFFYHDHSQIDYLSYNVGFLILFPLMFRYLYEVLYLRPFYNVFHDPYLYFIFGLLLFYTSSFPILGFINILITDNTQYQVYSELLNVGNIFLSLAYLGAALCSKPRILSTTSS
jgi:hypothetical protein